VADTAREKRRVAPFTLLAAIATLTAAAYLLGDGPAWWPAVDPRWLLAGAAVLAGVVLLATSVRRGGDD
jgi:hypothetical protein